MSVELPVGVVTTSKKAKSTEIEAAKRVAAACGLPYVRRDDAQHDRLLIVEKAAARLWLGETSLSSHPGMGLVRVRRLQRQKEPDPLIELAGIREGDRILDATFGFGQDALVLAYAAGETGSVVALERSPLLAALGLAGMPHWSKPGSQIARRIELKWGDSRRYLAEAPDKSFDVVFIDPMFRDPRSAAPDFAALRLLADPTPLDAALLKDAVRVAKRRVVVKDAWPGRELVRLGVEPIHARRKADIIFGVLNADS